MAGLSFTSQGATPFSGGTLANANRLGLGKGLAINPAGGVTTSSAANALNAAQSTQTPVASTPVKKTTITNPDGSSHTTEYHKPDEQPLTSGIISQSKTDDNKTTPTPASVEKPTFPGLLGSLASTSQAGSEPAKNYTEQTAQYGAGNLPIGQSAADIAKEYGQKIADVGGQGARFEAGQLSTGTSPVASGNAAITAQTTAAQQQALATGEEAALQGTGQQLTAEQQAANAANAAAGQATAGQGQEISGLGTAAGLAQPTLGGIGQVPFSPTDQSQGAPLGSTQPGGIQAAGSLLGELQGAQALGAAPGTAEAGVIGTQKAQVEGYKSALQQGQNLQAQLTDLIGTFGLNPNDINAVNAGLQKIAQNVSSPQYKILSNYVNDIANTYAQVLTPPGGSATDTTRSLATSMLDATAKGTSLIQTMKSLDQAAQAKIAGVSTTGSQNSVGPKTGTVQTKAGAVNTDW